MDATSTNGLTTSILTVRLEAEGRDSCVRVWIPAGSEFEACATKGLSLGDRQACQDPHPDLSCLCPAPSALTATAVLDRMVRKSVAASPLPEGLRGLGLGSGPGLAPITWPQHQEAGGAELRPFSAVSLGSPASPVVPPPSSAGQLGAWEVVRGPGRHCTQASW